MRNLWSLILLLLLIGGAGWFLWSGDRQSAAEEKHTVRIAYLPITHALPLFAEKELLTADDDVQVELIKYGSWPELMDALNTGKVDGASVLIELAVKAREQGIDVRAAALGHKDGNVIIGGNGIEKVEDLRGKIFAIPHKQSTHNLLLQQMLAEHGMSLQDLTVVELSPPEMPAGLAQGQIAGYCVAEPFGAKAIALGKGHILAKAEDLWPDSLCCALVFNGDFVDKHHELAKKATAKYLAAGKYLTEHEEEQPQIAQLYLKAKAKVVEMSLKLIRYDDLQITPEAYAELVKRMSAAKLIERIPEYEDFVDRTLLP